MIQIPALDRASPGRARNALGMSILEGSLHAVMIGVAESYLGAFAVELGHGPRAQGLLATLPLVLGAICQLFSPLLCAWFGSRKRVAVAGALGQTASMAGLILIAMAQSSSFSALLAARVGFWVAGGLMAPAWNAWMADLTVNIERSRYFARRSALNHVALLIAFGAKWLKLIHTITWRASRHLAEQARAVARSHDSCPQLTGQRRQLRPLPDSIRLRLRASSGYSWRRR